MPVLVSIHMARKPLDGTVAVNALKHGTGSLNIGATRLSTADNLNGGAYSGEIRRREEYSSSDKDASATLSRLKRGIGEYQPPPGRWPANVILEHQPNCHVRGTKRVPATSIHGESTAVRRSGVHAAAGGHQSPGRVQPVRGYADRDGLESVADWDCHPDCPVADLDQQSGIRPSSGIFNAKDHGTDPSGRVTSFGGRGTPNTMYGDSGGASRFFKQVQAPQGLISYLCNMIGAPGLPGVYCDRSGADLSAWLSELGDNALTGLVLNAVPTEEQTPHLLRVLMPGAHLLLIAPEDQPTGHTGAIRVEDAGFEIRDCILWVRHGGRFHYVSKASRSEREAGCTKLPSKHGYEAVEREEGSAGANNPRAGAGRTAKQVHNFHPCLHPEALVMTPKGYRPISEITVGDRVYSADGHFHAVEHVSRHPYTSPDLFEIKVTGTNYTTLASDNHPFLVYRPTRKRNAITGGQIMWLRADQMQKGDYTMTPDLAETPPSEDLDPEWWFVFGLWVAEGVAHRSGHGGAVYPSFTLHEKETDLIERIKSVFSSVNTGVYQKKGAKAVQVIPFDKAFGARFVELAGCGAATKSLHPSVWALPKNIRAAILEGYMAGDGGKVRTYLQAKTVSPDLASQMRLLAASVGYKANLFTYAPVEGKGIGDRLFKSVRQSYQIRLYSDNTRNVAAGTRKASRPYEVTHDGVRFVLSYVKDVSRVPYAGDVVNLSVEGSPTFQTAVGMSHNTVKPIELMEKLLADVPKDAVVLDPFLGSGTTGIACVKQERDFVGIEREEEYLRIADARVRHWDAAHAAWRPSVIESDVDHPKEEAPKELTLDDLFGG